MSIMIRKAHRSDRTALEQVLCSDSTFREDEIAVALELIDEAVVGSADYWILVAEDSFDNTDVTGGHASNQVVGYVCYGPTPMTKSTFDLYWVVTHKQARGRGVARRLIQAMEADLERGAAIRVETSQLEGYGAARKLYERLNYPEVCRLEDFYRPGDHLIVYYKRLM